LKDTLGQTQDTSSGVKHFATRPSSSEIFSSQECKKPLNDKANLGEALIILRSAEDMELEAGLRHAKVSTDRGIAEVDGQEGAYPQRLRSGSHRPWKDNDD
jgi:hypothetical protein